MYLVSSTVIHSRGGGQLRYFLVGFSSGSLRGFGKEKIWVFLVYCYCPFQGWGSPKPFGGIGGVWEDLKSR